MYFQILKIVRASSHQSHLMTSGANFPSTLVLIRHPDRSGLPDVMTPLQHSSCEQYKADDLDSLVLPNVPDPKLYGFAAYTNFEGFTQTPISTVSFFSLIP